MPDNRLNPRKLFHLGLTGLTLAGQAAARGLQPTRAPALAPVAAEAPAAVDTLTDAAFLRELACSKHDPLCVRDDAPQPVAMELVLQPPKHRSRAPHLPGATHAQGCARSSYAAPLLVEGQDGPLPVVLDTGSSKLAVKAEGMIQTETNVTTGYQDELTPVRDPGFEMESGIEEINQTVFASYGKGSWVGELLQGDVGFAHGPNVHDMAFSDMLFSSDFLAEDFCEVDNFKPATNRGILGLASRPSDFDGSDAFISRVAAEKPDFSFTFAPCHRDANVFWGPPPKHVIKGPMAYGLAFDVTYSHATSLAYIEVGKTRLPFGQETTGNLLFDTGTTAMVFPPAVTQAIANAIASHTGHNAWTSAFAEGPCFTLPPHLSFAAIDEALPKLTLGISAEGLGNVGKVHRITVPASNYLVMSKTHDGTNLLCALMGASISSPVSIFGAAAMTGHVFHFDEANFRVGIAEGHNTCVRD